MPKSLSRNNRSIFEQNPLTPAPLSPKGARGEWIRNYNPLSLGTPLGERVARRRRVRGVAGSRWKCYFATNPKRQYRQCEKIKKSPGN